MAEAAVYRNFTQAQLDKEYNPRETAPDFQDYFDRWDRDSKIARAKPEVKRDVPYGTGPDETLDIYPLGGAGPHPVMVYYHGGYWRRFGKADRGFIAPHMNQAGVMFVSVDYTLAPKASVSEIVAQCRRAMAWVAKNIAGFGGDPNRVYACGESAGGHLTAMVAQTDWAKMGVSPDPVIKGALAISGLYDLEPIRHSFLQPDVRLTPAVVEESSPIRHVRQVPTQMMLSVGLVESAEFQRQLNDYSAAMAAAGIRHDLVRVGGRNHFSIVDALCEPKNMLHLSLMRLMRPTAR
jgi:arylformamidase